MPEQQAIILRVDEKIDSAQGPSIDILVILVANGTKTLRTYTATTAEHDRVWLADRVARDLAALPTEENIVALKEFAASLLKGETIEPKLIPEPKGDGE